MTTKNTNGFLGWNAPHIHFTAEAMNAQPTVQWERVTEVINGCNVTFDRRVVR